MNRNYAEELLKKTRENYNLIAEEFSRTRAEVWPELKFLFDCVRDNDKILDLGCGNARYFEFLKNKQIEYIGVDNSEELIKIAQRRYLYPPKFSEGKLRRASVKFQTADALKLPFPDNYFDKIYSIAVFHHIPSKELRLQFLNEAKRVLKPTGFFILTVWRFYKKKELFYLIKYTILKLIGKSKLDFGDIFEPWQRKIERYYHWFSQRELKSLIKRSGFKVKKIGVVKNERSTRRNIYLIAEKQQLTSGVG